ncbi:hypothetical protein BH09PSE2_BH09PSE2_15330 [soil metagenome]
MILFLFAALLTVAVLAALTAPLLKPRSPPAPAERFNAEVYRQQLAELDSDVGRSLIPDAEVAPARLEIDLRLLAASRRDASSETAEPRRAPALAAGLLAAVVVLAGGALYLAVGRPSVTDHPFRGDRSLAAAAGVAAAPAPSAPSAEAAAEAAAPSAPASAAAPADPQTAQFAALLEKLQAKLRAEPGDPKGWTLLGQGMMRLNRPAEAEAAYLKALQLGGESDAGLFSAWAEAHVLTSGGKVDTRARQAFDIVLRAEPQAPQARFYVGLSKAQAGDVAGALSDWKALAADTPADAAYLPMIKARIAEAEKATAGR